MEHLIIILQWLMPGGIGAVITWIVSKTIRKARETKEVHDVYKTLYEHISETLEKLQNEVDNLHKELGRFRRAVSKSYGCIYYANCPVQHELQISEAINRKNGSGKAGRQPRNRDAVNKNDSGSGGENETDNSDTETA